MKCIVLFLLLCPALAQTLPDAPKSEWRSTASIMKDWKFWAGTGASIGSTLYDEQATLNGLKRGNCVEAGDDPYPTRGELMKKDFIMLGGLTAFKLFLAKAKLPWWSYSSFDEVITIKHIHGGIKWQTAC